MNVSNAKTNQTKRLTKSKFKLALECPSKLNYASVPDYVNTMDNNEMLKGLAEGGHQIGKLAQWIFSKQADGQGIPYHEVQGRLEQQLAETAEYLKHEQVVLFEPTFIVDNFLVRVDVLVKHGNQIQLIEVKSKSFERGEFPRNGIGFVKTDYLPYLQDVAFQTMVVQRCHADWQITPYLMMPNKNVVCTTADLHQLFSVRPDPENLRNVIVAMPPLTASIEHTFLEAVDVSQEVQELMKGDLLVSSRPNFHASIALADEWGADYAKGAEFTPAINAKKCGECEFYSAAPKEGARSGFHECWKRAKVPNFSDSVVREDLVLKLFDGRKVKQDAMDDYRFYLNELTQEEIGAERLDVLSTHPISTKQRQWMQASGEIPGGGSHYFNKRGFLEAQENWVYPYYFLDFEGAKSALPIRANQTPNQQIIFQYSIHVMHQDGRIEHHKQYLDVTHGDHAHARMLRALRDHLGQSGTIFRWSDYENTVLNALRSELQTEANPPDDRDELIAFIDSITKPSGKDKSRSAGARCMVDQAAVAANYYFHRNTDGSSSIKKVLPAVFESSDFLRETYEQACYGQNAVIPSLNIQEPIAWWQLGENGTSPRDPYDILRGLSTISDAEDELILDGEEVFSVSDGGAAMMAYMRMMSGAIPPEKHDQVKQMMLRYCELDTLAMVMIMQAWQHEARLAT